ncbi:hypothetical protein E3C22_20640 [Jiella endophytica]|uniref:APC family permease n=1 Tax=Jiella endophytica TaxID=2558362 RepID=A0A4Y8RCS4_9HYPH|nr:hypothetical protein [Jiella endophytica]TFF19175.1 hypothetical protein E3C22_20640 [Jiella endophytica]
MTDLIVVAAVLAAVAVLLLPAVRRSTLWRATVTPLASIIGSGFLVLGPILTTEYGGYAPMVMALLCLAAYGFGAAVRANIAAIEAAGDRSRAERWLEDAASWALAFAYVVSVAYYLNLFGAFALHLTPFDTPFEARLLTSAMLILILLVGWGWGFKALERMETVSVSLKLAIIAGLLVGLGLFFFGLWRGGALYDNPEPTSAWRSITLAFGLIVTVQGFETSRYLGRSYDARTRIASMRLAQWISAAIYLVYILFLTMSFPASETHLSETAIIDMMGVVAPILPAMLVLAALAAQFSAAIADTGGAGGLTVELTGGRLSQRQAYAVLCSLGLAITWTSGVFEIIAYASRAFALYYGLQSALAAVAAHRAGRNIRAALFLLMACLGVAIVLFGVPAE